MLFTVVLSIFPAHLHHYERNLVELVAQSMRDFEIVVVHDGDLSRDTLDNMTQQALAALGEIPARAVAIPAGHSLGDNTRHAGLGLARGDYVAWLNADNIVHDCWLELHADNITRQPGCISVVNTYTWQRFMQLPDAIAQCSIDLLNFALPAPLARQIDAFGPWIAPHQHGQGDWHTLERALAAAPLQWDPFGPVCAENR